MNANSKRTLKVLAVAAGLIAVLIPTGCGSSTTGSGTVVPAAQGPDASVAAPLHVIV
ncbi:MAG TPA: hypothetical protein VME67_04670 [Mycobacterium sp.]|nr:hypothetical protein [Mycobacterium sp.]HTX94186.1 hypothetical protein [Mycobacterium sp.]